MVTAGSNGRGQIHPHQRNANITGTIIGDSIVLGDQYIVDVQEIEGHAIDVQKTRAHRNRIKHIYTAWEEKFPNTTQLESKC